MTKTITQEDLIRFIYHETNAEETAGIQRAIQNDWQMKEEYESLMRAHSLLGSSKLVPGQSCIDSILEYSKRHTPVMH